nr:MAG TPA: hypothetical protein [Caudoviricetes sp.]
MDNKYIAWADIKGVRYPLCLNVGSSAALEKEFGNVPGAINCISGHVQNDEFSELINATIKVARLLARAGRDYLRATAQMAGNPTEDIPEFPADELLSAALSINEAIELWNACYAAMRIGSHREVEVAKDNSPKNAENAM